MQANRKASRDVPSEALSGATKAFGKPPVKPKPHIENYNGNNGALAAATKAGGAVRPQSMPRSKIQADQRVLRDQYTGGSNASEPYRSEIERDLVRIRLGHLGLDGTGNATSGQLNGYAKSTSLIAAALAASQSPNHTGKSQTSPDGVRRHAASSPWQNTSRSQSEDSVDQTLDLESIRPTKSLTRMFEQNTAEFKTTSKRANSRIGEITVPRPQSAYSAKSPSIANAQRQHAVPAAPPSRQDSIPPKPTLSRPVANKPKPIKVPKPVAFSSITPSDVKSVSISSNPRTRPHQHEIEDDASSDDSFVSASSSYKPSFRATLSKRRSMPITNSTQASIDSLANAIVASSLASSRAVSPAMSIQTVTFYPPPPPPPRRHFFHDSKDPSRTPSPSKPGGFRTTMRKPKTDEKMDEGEMRRGIKHLMKKHPNKHHEGDRKRWRDVVTESERRRYEAVWASNKGLHNSIVLSTNAASPKVVPGAEISICNLVARDLFKRSRLQTDILEEIYDLVDRQRIGRLAKEEFVVGLWLCDQRLKGRKLPVRVSESVWRSVGILGELKIKKMGR